MKYRVYIDETGNPDMRSSGDPNHRFLSLTGVIVSLDHVASRLHPETEALKREFFGSHPDEPVILHRKELVNRRRPFEALRNDELRQRFDEALLRLLDSWDYSVVTVCLDKLRHEKTFHEWRHDPYHYCLAVVVERYVGFLEEIGATGDVMAESRGGREDRRLKREFNRLWHEGTENVSIERVQAVLTSRQLKVKSKAANVAGLQLADLLAHPCRNEVLHAHGLLPRDLPPFGRAICEILANRYVQRGDERVGRVLLR
jgi:hypothetical protein